MSDQKKIILIQGANLTYLGKREPHIYGTTRPEELNATLLNHAQKNGLFLEIFYTNVEGEAINKIYQCADDGFDGIVMNPAGFSYAGYALKDCGNPYIQYRNAKYPLRIVGSVGRPDYWIRPLWLPACLGCHAASLAGLAGCASVLTNSGT